MCTELTEWIYNTIQCYICAQHNNTIFNAHNFCFFPQKKTGSSVELTSNIIQDRRERKKASKNLIFKINTIEIENSTKTMTVNYKYLFIKIQNELIKMTIFPFISINKWNCNHVGNSNALYLL